MIGIDTKTLMGHYLTKVQPKSAVVVLANPMDYIDALVEQGVASGPNINSARNSDFLIIEATSKDQAISMIRNLPKGRPGSKQVWVRGRLEQEL